MEKNVYIFWGLTFHISSIKGKKRIYEGIWIGNRKPDFVIGR